MTVSTTSSATVLDGPSSVADSRGLGDEPFMARHYTCNHRIIMNYISDHQHVSIVMFNECIVLLYVYIMISVLLAIASYRFVFCVLLMLKITSY